MDIFSTLGTTATVGSAIYAYDREKGEIDKEKAKKVGTTSLITGATTVVGQISDKMTNDRIHREYASAYVESMSDEELERALVALGELESLEDVNNTTKTI
jgi:hypothetical protein